MATSVNDIAKAAGVSHTTVIRALRGRGRIAAATKARILEVADELNYRPNMIARSLVSGKSMLIGLLIGPTDPRASAFYIDPIYRIVRQAGFGLLVHVAVDDPDGERVCVEEMICNRVRGVLAQPTVLSGKPEAYRPLLAANIPVVMFDRMFDGFEAPQVVADQYRIGRIATEYLISLGHRRIAHFAMPMSQHIGRERMRGFMDAMQDAGLPIHPPWVFEVGFRVEDGADAMRRLLSLEGNPPTAIVARHDWLAIGALTVATEAGLAVPKDISVIGVGDQFLADKLAVPLTTVRHPSEKVAAAATRHLLDMVAGRSVEPKPYLVSDMRVIARASCAPPAS